VVPWLLYEMLFMNTRLSQWLFGLFLFSFVSCSKELSFESGQKPISGNFYATIDGKLWNADSLQIVFVSNGAISINGLSKSGDQISMILPSFKTGTYTLNTGSVSYAYYTNIFTALPIDYVSNSGIAGGTVTISTIDTIHHLVSGSFAFTLVNLADNNIKTVTQGIFNYLPYNENSVVVVPPVSGNGLDTLNATVDGASFVGMRIQSLRNDTYPNELLIAGSNEDGTQRMEVIMPLNVTPGTYNLDYETSTYIGIYASLESVTLISQANGILTVISNDAVKRRIKGTFRFIATPAYGSANPATITDGYFSVNY
jgi:hypothetical protein